MRCEKSRRSLTQRRKGGKVFTEIVEDCSKAARMPIIQGQVLSEATLDADGWKSDGGLVLGGCGGSANCGI